MAGMPQVLSAHIKSLRLFLGLFMWAERNRGIQSIFVVHDAPHVLHDGWAVVEAQERWRQVDPEVLHVTHAPHHGPSLRCRLT